jgi:peroxiredoxin
MALRQSRMLALGMRAPDFSLPDASGRRVSLHDFRESRGLLVAFICNHCPYVKHLLEGFTAFANEYQDRGLATVAISSNDVAAYPQDGPVEMARVARELGFRFPYLHDESQAVARAYEAVCTPDLFLFDRDRRLVYRGQFDGSRPGNKIPVTGADLRAAADAVLRGEPVPPRQVASAGCSIKWKKGNEPGWA